ncbi:MAG: S-methyl-5-thioribose-1-phosphate isomerase, partial [Chloroflexi bacterium]|nr:S-methyl-5-thioribose-1-phosphate isomerase [Chloroflexota bacterium]
MLDYSPIEWLGDRVKILDQTRLPGKEVYLELSRYQDIASAIVELKIRGAPAIGVAGGYAVALGALKIKAASKSKFQESLRSIIAAIGATRPTARNLFQAIERMQRVAFGEVQAKAEAGTTVEQIKTALVAEAIK